MLASHRLVHTELKLVREFQYFNKWAGRDCRNSAFPNKLHSLCSCSILRAAKDHESSQQLLTTSTQARAFPITLSDQHLVVIGVLSSVIMGALCCIFIAAIPTLLTIKKAAEAMEKLANTSRKELPGTMAAVRLSGMEISDLTMELSEFGQEITSGVRRSTRAVRAAEDELRRARSLASTAIWQAQAVPARVVVQPIVAEKARNVRIMIVHARTIVKNLRRVSSWLGKHVST